MASRTPLVVFMPSGKRGNFPVGTPLLQAARSLGHLQAVIQKAEALAHA